MSHTKLYTAIYAVLFVFATAQAVIERLPMIEESYWVAFWIIIALSVIKAVIVAAYYQHLRWEPRAVSYLVVGGVVAAVALTAAASFSIT